MLCLLALFRHKSLNLFDGARNLCEKLAALTGDVDIVFNANATKALELGNPLGNEEAGLLRVVQGIFDLHGNEVDAGLDCQDHTLLEDAAKAERAETRLVGALNTLGVTANIVGVKANQVAEAVGHEDGTDECLHHLVDVALEKPSGLELFAVNAVRKTVHVLVGHTGLDLRKDSTVRLQDGVVNDLLVLGKLAVGRERAGDVRSVAVVLASHVKKAHVAILDLLVIGSSRVAVVQRGAVVATATDARVRLEAHATVVVAIVTKHALKLVLVEARADVAHDFLVREARDLVGVTHHIDLGRRLVNAALDNLVKENVLVDSKVAHALKLDGDTHHLAVGVQTIHDEELRLATMHGAKDGGELVHVADTVDLVLGLEVVGRVDLAHPHRILGGEAGDEEDALARCNVDRAIAVWLADAKDPVEVRLLAEERLVVRVVATERLAAHEDSDARVRAPGLADALHEATTVVGVHAHGDGQRVVAQLVGRHVRCKRCGGAKVPLWSAVCRHRPRPGSSAPSVRKPPAL
eukprot:m.287376 g.287376  ORF g.287376 m.287376 type:complete len:522 (+) comp11763_c0_seq1:119-1684(+)